MMTEGYGLLVLVAPVLLSWLVFGVEVGMARLRYEMKRRYA